MTRAFKLSGMIAPQDSLHQFVAISPGAAPPPQHQIAPNTVNVTITDPGPQRQIGIPQYAPTVVGTGAGYDPGGDCSGSFMSAKFQPNNNCYAYACDIASNTFAQPGRASGHLITAATLTGPAVQAFAEHDGLIHVGKTVADIKAFAAARTASGDVGGHFVALMISLPGNGNWPGDYHWARCDDRVNFASWSQKDGGDQVTDFDFAGQPITDPSTANWSVNQGPVNPPADASDLVVEYDFYCFMFVPPNSVNII
jgi:hypothetical protein